MYLCGHFLISLTLPASHLLFATHIMAFPFGAIYQYHLGFSTSAFVLCKTCLTLILFLYVVCLYMSNPYFCSELTTFDEVVDEIYSYVDHLGRSRRFHQQPNAALLSLSFSMVLARFLLRI